MTITEEERVVARAVAASAARKMGSSQAEIRYRDGTRERLSLHPSSGDAGEPAPVAQ